MPHEIIIPKKMGEPIRTIYSPEAQKVLEGVGEITARRASHVEPGTELSEDSLKRLVDQTGANWTEYVQLVDDGEQGGVMPVLKPPYRNKWWADCSPVDGPVLGPFDDRDAALAAESKWLKDNNIPTCRECADNPTHEQADNLNEYRTQIEPPTMPPVTQAELNLLDGGD